MDESRAVDGRPRTIVAVVGAGHCPGIMERIRQARERPDSGNSMIDCLKDVVETKKLKLEESEELKFLVNQVSSLPL